MLAKKRFPLRLKFSVIVLICIVVGIAIYFLCQLPINAIGAYLYSEDREAIRIESYVDDLHKYVKENGLKSTATKQLKKWCNDSKDIYFMLFDEGNLVLIIDEDNIFEYEAGEMSDSSGYEIYDVDFKDGKYQVSILDCSDGIFYLVSDIAAILIAILVAFILFMWQMRKLIGRIRAVSLATIQMADDINYSIQADANDEIGDLSQNIEKMRQDIILQYNKKNELITQNYELITNLSHDIRTPLTSIICYNEMMLKDYTEANDIKQYAQYSLDKAMQLKEMSDKLFDYFLSYDGRYKEKQLKEVSALIFVEQMISEHACVLESKGYSLKYKIDIPDVYFETDFTLIGRVFDNIFSNVEKYADKTKDILIVALQEEENLVITVSNHFDDTMHQKESTQIGLLSCKKIMEILSGYCEFKKENGVFEARITICCRKGIEDEKHIGVTGIRQ